MEIKKHIPNLITYINMLLGIVAILLFSQQQIQIHESIPWFLILLAGIGDRYDGKLAMKWNAQSLLGKQLDSFADLISFGIAPMIGFWQGGLSDYGILGMLPIIAYISSGVFRLIRYHMSNNINEYNGLPTTAAGMTLSGLSLLFVFFKQEPMHVMSLVMLSLMLSYLMMARFPMKKI